jgi:hypothetical protein
MRTARTDHSINAHPRVALRHVPAQPSGRYDETGSAASSTNTCRSHEVTGLSAPTSTIAQEGDHRAHATVDGGVVLVDPPPHPLHVLVPAAVERLPVIPVILGG